MCRRSEQLPLTIYLNRVSTSGLPSGVNLICCSAFWQFMDLYSWTSCSQCVLIKNRFVHIVSSQFMSNLIETMKLTSQCNIIPALCLLGVFCILQLEGYYLMIVLQCIDSMYQTEPLYHDVIIIVGYFQGLKSMLYTSNLDHYQAKIPPVFPKKGLGRWKMPWKWH